MPGICRSPARKITIGDPNVHTCNRISDHNAQSGSEIQPIWELMPTARSTRLTRPSTPNICRHNTAIATEAPSIEGR